MQQTEHSLETLNKRFEELVLHRLESNMLSKAHRQQIEDKFANKSLEELHEIVCQLDNPKSSYNE